MRKLLTLALLALALTGAAVTLAALDPRPALASDSSDGGGGR
ncbi:hypothetical protein [Methylosinus sp. Ce-a6]|nr:hypothetical protein [Methylosinus sp. Ce-a6]